VRGGIWDAQHINIERPLEIIFDNGTPSEVKWFNGLIGRECVMDLREEDDGATATPKP
jgi:hypothetical protein